VSREPSVEIRAAGGIIRRRVRRGLRLRIEIAVVHRPRYDDWSFPKGKREATDTTDEDTARREVEEETGLRCRLSADLGEVRYRDARGRDKVVRYWSMEPLDPTVRDGSQTERFTPNREVDELRWCTPAEATALLTYDHDRALLARLAERDTPGPTKERTAS
jgi:8-oxo-dGTP diphosphatase